MDNSEGYLCNICDRSFSREKALLNHKNLIHPQNATSSKYSSATSPAKKKHGIMKPNMALKRIRPNPADIKNKHYNPAPYFGFETLTQMFKKTMKPSVEKMQIPEKLKSLVEEIQEKYRKSCEKERNVNGSEKSDGGDVNNQVESATVIQQQYNPERKNEEQKQQVMFAENEICLEGPEMLSNSAQDEIVSSGVIDDLVSTLEKDFEAPAVTEAENSTVESIGDVPVLAVEDAGRREMNGDNNSTSSLIHKEICPPSTRKGIQNASVKNSSTNNDASSFVDSVNQIVASSDGKGYWCDICSRGFSRLAALDKHKNFSHDVIRKAASGAGDSLLRHQKRSSASRFRFKCPICNRRFVKRSSFISHQKQHGKTKNVRKDKGTLKRLKASVNKQRISYPCDECTKSFPSASLLRAHTKLSHKKDKLSHPDEPVACRECGELFDSKSKLSLHEQNHRRNRLKCELCCVRYPTFDALMQHVCGEHENPYPCPECPLAFKDKKELNKHSTLHVHKDNRGSSFWPFMEEDEHLNKRRQQNVDLHSRCSRPGPSSSSDVKVETSGDVDGATKVYCDMCNIAYGTLQQRNKHVIKTHGPEWVHVCQLCLKVFPDRGMLLRHQVIHKRSFDDRCRRDDFKHDCELCDLTFIDQQSFLSHQNEKHCDVKHLVCPQCHECFIDQDLLEIHVNSSHADVETWCNLCGMAFGVVHEFFRHKATAHSELKTKTTSASQTNTIHEDEVEEDKEEYQCKICDHVFMDVKDFVRHQKTHPKDDRFRCVYCNESHPNKYSLQQHLPCAAIKGKWGDFKYACDTCFRAFSSPRKLHQHKNGLCRLLNKSRSAAEEHASRPLSQASSQVHSTVVPTKTEAPKVFCYCDSCGKKFGSVSVLKMHKQTHFRDKRFACEFCGLGFADNNELARHRLDHSHDSEHTCFICNKMFLETEELFKHELEHDVNNDSFCSVKLAGTTPVKGKPGVLQVLELGSVIEDIIDRKRRELP